MTIATLVHVELHPWRLSSLHGQTPPNPFSSFRSVRMINAQSKAAALSSNVDHQKDHTLVTADSNRGWKNSPFAIRFGDLFAHKAPAKPCQGVAAAVAVLGVLLLQMVTAAPRGYPPAAAWALSGGMVGGSSFGSSSSSSSSSRSSSSSSGSSSSSPSFSSSKSAGSSPRSSSSYASSGSSSPSRSSSCKSSSSSESPPPFSSSCSCSCRCNNSWNAVKDYIYVGAFSIIIATLLFIFLSDPKLMKALDEVIEELANGKPTESNQRKSAVAESNQRKSSTVAESNQSKSSIIKLQVGLFGSMQSLRRDLNKIAETADTSCIDGLVDTLRRITWYLIRVFGSTFSSHSTVYVESNPDAANDKLMHLAKEQQKFDEVSLYNINNKKIKLPENETAITLSDEYMVITIIAVVANGLEKFPTSNNNRDLQKALEKLHFIPSNQIQGVIVMWAPQKKNDVLSEEELHAKYPHLREKWSSIQSNDSNGSAKA
ncbi:unnamed protein product [Cuscuta epithymum]|uniref:Uncharacterized protein n=1 Tax=Cuscuta epithymum TaxID=186058 RepID=A0AAV0DZ68_9ASTE|nr:unnamed protein product [Cuscuta epithymum]